MKQITPNGKHLLMFAYQTHDYMDMEPENNFRTIESEEKMDEFIAHMREHWNSGTISDAKEVTPYEFFQARQSEYWKGYEGALDEGARDCTPEWIEKYNKYLATLDDLNELNEEEV